MGNIVSTVCNGVHSRNIFFCEVVQNFKKKSCPGKFCIFCMNKSFKDHEYLQEAPSNKKNKIPYNNKNYIPPLHPQIWHIWAENLKKVIKRCFFRLKQVFISL